MEYSISLFRSWIGSEAPSPAVGSSYAADSGTAELVVPARRVTGLLTVVAVCLLFLSLAGDVVSLGAADGSLISKFPKAFSVDRELNIPAFFSMLLLLASAALLSCIAFISKGTGSRDYRFWAVLAAGFCFMAFDEIAAVHEKLIEPLRTMIGGKNLGIFYYAWVLPAIVVVILSAGVFFRFWLRLAPRIRFLIFLAGCTYLGGALGFELIGGKYAEFNGRANLVYVFLTTIEEALEIVGCLIFLKALFQQLDIFIGGRIAVRLTQ